MGTCKSFVATSFPVEIRRHSTVINRNNQYYKIYSRANSAILICCRRFFNTYETYTTAAPPSRVPYSRHRRRVLVFIINFNNKFICFYHTRVFYFHFHALKLIQKMYHHYNTEINKSKINIQNVNVKMLCTQKYPSAL